MYSRSYIGSILLLCLRGAWFRVGMTGWSDFGGSESDGFMNLVRVDFHLEIGFDSFRNLQVDKFLSKLTVSATLETSFPRSIRTSPSSSWSHLSWRRSTLAIILTCPNRIKAYVGVPRATQSVLIISRVV